MEAAISAGVGLPSPGKRPVLPNNFFKFPVLRRLKAVDQYLSTFEYKRTPQTNFNSHKFRPLARLMDTAKMMIYSPQPIKCVEAVFLAMYLTAGMPDVDRIPVGFKTEEDTKVHQHIVLVVRHGAKYGAFGISRQPNLMNKEFQFDSLSSIVGEFKRAYEKVQHTVLNIWIGLPVEHNVESYNFVCWRYLTLAPTVQSWKECCAEMEKHAALSKRLWEKWLVEGQANSAPILSKKEQELLTKAKPLKLANASQRRPSSCLKLSTSEDVTTATSTTTTTSSVAKVAFCEPLVRYFPDSDVK